MNQTTTGPSPLDAIVVSNYGASDSARMSSDDATAVIELHVGGYLGSYPFLSEYFAAGRDADQAQARLRARPLSERMPTFLSGVYLADFLRRKQNLNVRVINDYSQEKERFLSLLAAQPRFVIISSSLILAPGQIGEITRVARQQAPGVRVIVGGSKIYKSYKTRALHDAGGLPDFPAAQLARVHYFFSTPEDPADYYIVNTRGEDTLLKLLTGLREGTPVDTLDNLAYVTPAGTWQINPIQAEPDHLSNWLIDWNRVDPDCIGYEIPITVKQGCPFRCNFCDFIALDRDLSSRPLDLVFHELAVIRDRFPGRSVYFVDENLFFTRDQLTTFCRRLQQEQPDIRWRGLCRANVIDPETARILRDSGCYNISMGIESGDNEVLTHMNKKVSAEQNLRAVCCLNEQRIDTDCTFVVGFPGETDATLQNTIDMINRFPDNGQAFNFYHAFPFILTPLSRASSPEMRSHFSLRGGQNRWQHATMSSQEAARNVVRMFLEVQHAFSRYIATPETTFLRNTDPRHWQFLRARQKLVQGRIRGISRADEDSLWNELASAFAPTPSAKSPSDQPAPVR